MKYGKGTNKGTLKVRRKCGTATVKVRLHSTELVRSRKTFFNRTYNVAPTVHSLTKILSNTPFSLSHLTKHNKISVFPRKNSGGCGRGGRVVIS